MDGWYRTWYKSKAWETKEWATTCHKKWKRRPEEDSNPLYPLSSTILDQVIRNAGDPIRTRPPMQYADDNRTRAIITSHYISSLSPRRHVHRRCPSITPSQLWRSRAFKVIEPRTNKDLPFSRIPDILIDPWMRTLQPARNFSRFLLT